MDFNLSSENKMIIKAAKDFAQRVIEPVAAKIDSEDYLPEDILLKFAEAKMLGMTVPKEYGGLGTGAFNVILITEELAKAGSSAFWPMAVNNSVTETIYHWGTEEIKRKYIPLLCDGTNYAGVAFTEPGTGSDPKAITTTAVPDGDYYILNGVKRFITHGHLKGYGIFFAKDETGRVTAFILEKNIEGYTYTKPYALMGLGGQGLVDVFLKNVRVHKSDILGEKGKGFKILLKWIAGERVQQMAYMVGAGQACLDESIKYTGERIVGGKPMNSMQGIQWMLAEMYASIEACRWWTYRLALKQDAGGGSIEMDSAALKLFTVPAIQEVARKALQLHGSYGYCKDYKVERLYRVIAHAGVTASSTELQKTIVGSTLARSAG